MQSVIDDFEQRVKEVHQFFTLLKLLEEPDALLVVPSRKTRRNKKIDSDWPTILRAAAFLVLYNLVEGALRGAFVFVYDKIQSENRSFDALRTEVQQLWIDQQHKQLDSFSASQSTFRDKAKEIVEIVLGKIAVKMDGTKLPVSGNLDGKMVIEVCRKHGVSAKIHRAAQGGFRLSTVKSQRNALAHGNVSFVECGRGYATADVEAIKDQSVIFMRSVLANVRRYAEKQRYAV